MSLAKLLQSIPKRPIYLHFDINRTIIQTDAVDGKTLAQVLAANVSAASYGTTDRENKTWSMVHGPEERQRSEDLISYSDYIDEVLYGPPALEGVADASERLAIMKQVRKQRQAKYYAFPDKGSPGEDHQWAVEKQTSHLELPSGTGQCNIIPSFFQVINELSEADYPFVLFFRTFGTDLPHIMAEWKSFIFGELEYKPKGPVLEQMRSQWIEPSIGAVYRDNEGMYLTWGVAVGPPLPPHGTEGGLAYLHSLGAYKTAHKVEDRNLLPEMLAEAKKANGVAGFVDYFYHWSSHGEKAHAGKLMPTDQKNYHVFFDDNIFLFDADGCSIVDFRREDGSALSDAEAAQYAVQVKPYFAIVENDYFVRSLMERLEIQAKSRE